jgi:hypothetical protein
MEDRAHFSPPGELPRRDPLQDETSTGFVLDDDPAEASLRTPGDGHVFPDQSENDPPFFEDIL